MKIKFGIKLNSINVKMKEKKNQKIQLKNQL